MSYDLYVIWYNVINIYSPLFNILSRCFEGAEPLFETTNDEFSSLLTLM